MPHSVRDSAYESSHFAHTIKEVISLDKKLEEKQQEQKILNEFNNVTQKVKPENQNQTHNVRKEGIAPINQKR